MSGRELDIRNDLARAVVFEMHNPPPLQLK